MSWREQLRPASFRGVGFHVLSSGATFGRRIAVHEYPFRDLPYVEDLGRRARNVRIEALLIGDDYMTRRDALIAAIEQAGPGPLVHPTLGELIVSVDDGGVQFDESTADGGMARVSFSVIESGQAQYPAATIATAEVVADRAQAVNEATAQALSDSLDVDDLPGFAVASAYERINEALRLIEDILATQPGVGDVRGAVLRLINALRPELTPLLSQPLSLARRLQAIFAALGLTSDASGMGNALFRFMAYGSQPLTNGTTPTRVQQSSNDTQIVEFIRCSAVCTRADLTTQIEFDDYTSASTTRDSLVEQIDQVGDTTVHDDLFQDLRDLRAAVIRDLGERGADLARLVTVTLPQTMPALVLAYDLYGDPDRDEEIALRNHEPRPGFLPGRVPLEVRSDA